MAATTGIEVDIECLTFAGQELVLHHYRIDQNHSNAYAEWLHQGRPMYPTPDQRAIIKARDDLELLEPAQKLLPDEGKITLNFDLPVHGISLLIIGPNLA